MKRKKKTLGFEQAVQATPDVANCYQAGLQGLESRHRSKIIFTDHALCNGSLNIDACTVSLYPRDSRWDYAIGYAGEVYFVEVHSAETGEVRAVLLKLQWLKDWLLAEAPAIKELKSKHQPFIWIQSGRYSIPKNAPQVRILVKAGLRPISHLEL